ncbi:MAG: methylmalonyl-CoA mutase family protein [Hyphomicrobiales bacterium]
MQKVDLNEFPAARREDWLARVDAVLKGAGFASLVSKTADGIAIEPLYGEAQGPRAERAVHAPWTVYQRADHPDGARANLQALDDVAHGARGLSLTFAGQPSARGFGLDVKNLPRVLDGIALHAIALRLEGGSAEARALAATIAKQPIDPGRLDVSFGLENAELAGELAAQGFRGPFVEADGRPWHEKGATEAQELGAVLATAVRHLRALEKPAPGVTLAAGQDMFLTLAKFRAMRLLWRRVLDASGLPDEPLRIHAETSWRMMARLDPHSNILRAVAAVFGAGLGGADSICVLPFSLAQGLPDALARRVARNVQTVLLEESNLWRVADPASGAGYVEHLTQALCEKAWSVLQRIEKSGEWPEPNAQSAQGLPVIGTSAYRLEKEYPAAVESLA